MLLRLEHKLYPRFHADETIRSEPDRFLLKGVVADLLDVFPGYNPGGARGDGSIECHKVRPRFMQDKAHPMGIDDLNGLHPFMQQLGRGSLITQEAEFDIVRCEWIAIVEGQ